MPPIDQAFYSGVVRRMRRSILLLGIAGAIALAIWQGWQSGAGFLIGAAASYLSFWRWERVVDSVAFGTKRRSPWLLAMRFVLLIAAGYVIIELTGVNAGAALFGLLVPGVAATVEIIYELALYGTRS
jgi:ATP synthase I subunit